MTTQERLDSISATLTLYSSPEMAGGVAQAHFLKQGLLIEL